MAERLGMSPAVVEGQAQRIASLTRALEVIAADVARTGWASRSPSQFDLIPGVSLVMTAGSILLAESAAADVRAALSSTAELVGRLGAEAAHQRETSSAADSSYRRGAISPAQAKAKISEIMANPELLNDLTPAEISALWRHLTPAQAEQLWRGSPRLVGNLSGVPFDVRINANRLVAVEDLAAGTWTSSEHRDYLVAIANGDVQVVTYDPESHRIVEAIGLGVWNPETQMFDPRTEPVAQVITYVPGTFTDDQGMYEGKSRAIGAWLAENHSDAVVFIYKDGLFPGGVKGTADMATGIAEANDAEFARRAGQRLAAFDRDMGLDPTLGSASQTAIGHSWGLADITNSEQSGAHYDTVISLAGAWVPEGWKPDPSTDYHHHSYVDWLSVLQDRGLVGEGRNPDVTPGFDVHLYEGPHDRDANPFNSVGILLDNHDLIASTRRDENGDMENKRVLIEIEKEIFG